MTGGMEVLNLKRIVAKNPKSLLFAYLADSLRESSLGMNEKLDEALEVADIGLDSNPDFVQGLLVRGRILFEKGDFRGAKSDFEAVADRDPFCLSAQKLLIEASENLGTPPGNEVYAEILNSLGTDGNTASEPSVIQAPPPSLSSALDDVLNQKDDGEAGIVALLLQTVDAIILKSTKPQTQAQPQVQPQKQPAQPQPTPPPPPPPKAPPAKPSLSLPEVAPASLIEKAPSPTSKQPAQSLPNLDALISEQLTSKMDDIPDLTKDMSSLLASITDEPKPEPKPEPELKLEPKLAAPATTLNLDSLISEQLSAKVEEIPDLTKDMASLLASAMPAMPAAPAASSIPPAPNLDSLISEQLAPKVEDIPDLTKDMASLLASATPLTPSVPIPTAPAPSALNLDALINEQLSAKMEDIPDLTKDMISLLGNTNEPEPELVPYVPPTKKTKAVNIDDLVNEQLSSRVDNVPDLTKDMDALLKKHPTQTLAELYMDQGLTNKAIEVYKELMVLEPNNEDIKTKLALAQLQAKT